MRQSHFNLFKRTLKEGRLLWLLKQGLKIPLYRLDAASGMVPQSLLGPIQGIFFVTYACNLRCYFCDLPTRHIEYVKKKERTELSREEKLSVIDDFRAIGTTGVGFTGGEPGLLPEIYDLVKRCSRHRLVSHLSTNGYAFRSVESCERYLDAGLKAASISIDGPEHIHNRIRGRKDSYEQCLQAVRNILEVRARKSPDFSVVTTTVITKDNIDVIPEVVKELKAMGIDKIGFMPVHDIGLDYDREKRKTEFEVSDPSPVDKVIHYLKELQQEGVVENTPAYLELFEDSFSGKPLPIRCYAGYTTVEVDSWGDVYPCLYWAFDKRSFGNIRQKSLAQFWAGEEMRSMRKAAGQCRDCYWNCQTELNLLVSKKRVPGGMVS